MSPTGRHWDTLVAPGKSLCSWFCALHFHAGFCPVEKCLVWLNPNPQSLKPGRAASDTLSRSKSCWGCCVCLCRLWEAGGRSTSLEQGSDPSGLSLGARVCLWSWEHPWAQRCLWALHLLGFVSSPANCCDL